MPLLPSARTQRQKRKSKVSFCWAEPTEFFACLTGRVARHKWEIDGPILVFFAPLSFFQKKVEGFLSYFLFQAESKRGMALGMERTRGSGALFYPAVYLLFFPLLLVFAGCGRGGGASGTYMEAEELLGRGKFLIAIEKYDSVVRDYADSPFAPKSLYKKARIYNRFLKDRRRAIEAYYKLLSLYPGSLEAYLSRRDLALIYSLAGDHTKAVEQYQWLLDSGHEPGKEEEYRYTIALEYFRMNDFEQAGAELKELLSMATKDEIVSEALLLQGDTYYITGDLERAMEAYRETIERFASRPVAIRARFNLARALEEAEREDEAILILEGLRGVYPNEAALERTIRGIKARKREKARQRRRRRR